MCKDSCCVKTPLCKVNRLKGSYHPSKMFTIHPVALPVETKLTQCVYCHPRVECGSDEALSSSASDDEKVFDTRNRFMYAKGKIPANTLLLLERVWLVDNKQEAVTDFGRHVGFDMPLMLNWCPRRDLDEKDEKDMAVLQRDKLKQNSFIYQNEDMRKLYLKKKSMKQIDPDKFNENQQQIFKYLVFGCWSSMFNHSCQPNAAYAIRKHDNGYAFLYVYSFKDIQPQEEINIKYGSCQLYKTRFDFKCTCTPPKEKLNPEEFFELITKDPLVLDAFLHTDEGGKISTLIAEHIGNNERTPDQDYQDLKDLAQEIKAELAAQKASGEATVQEMD